VESCWLNTICCTVWRMGVHVQCRAISVFWHSGYPGGQWNMPNRVVEGYEVGMRFIECRTQRWDAFWAFTSARVCTTEHAVQPI